MSTPKDATLSLKVVMNKQKSKVLFAEANSDVVDVLLSFLTLPLGKIVTILEKHDGNEAAVVGSLTSLYRGLSNLDSSHFDMGGAKQMLLNPTTSFQLECRRLKLDISDSQPRKVYYCKDRTCGNDLAKNVSMFSDMSECGCGKPLNRYRQLIEAPIVDADGGVFINKSSSSFIICDDLRVVPVASGFLQTLKLKNLGITHIDGAEMTTLSIGINEIMDLLKLSLFSATPLTDLVIKKACTAAKPDQRGFLLHHNAMNSGKKMILKVFLHKSTNEFLLAEAADEFVEFLFRFLAIPLAGVEYLYRGRTCFKNIDNLYSSVTDVIDDKCFATPYVKDSLTNPKLAHGYISRNQILPLTEISPHGLELCGVPIVLKPSIGKGSFIKEQTMYIVSDDLTVSPLSIASSFSILRERGISFSGVIEKDFVIGVEEALRILKASLMSTTVLSDALINPNLNKHPKQSKIERYAQSVCLGYVFHR